VAGRLALQGVLTHGAGGAALIALDGQPARPLRVGAVLDGLEGGWTLRAVTPSAAVLAAHGRELRLELPPPDERPRPQAAALPRPVAAPRRGAAVGRRHWREPAAALIASCLAAATSAWA
jgi:general secretion pathway protein C